MKILIILLFIVCSPFASLQKTPIGTVSSVLYGTNTMDEVSINQLSQLGVNNAPKLASTITSMALVRKDNVNEAGVSSLFVWTDLKYGLCYMAKDWTKVKNYWDIKGACALTTNCLGDFWVVEKERDRVVHLRYDPTTESMNLVNVINGFSAPSDVCYVADDQNGLLIADFNNNRIVYCNGMTGENKEYFSVVGDISINGPRSVSTGRGASWNSSGSVDSWYVVDEFNRVLKINASRHSEGITPTVEALFDVDTSSISDRKRAFIVSLSTDIRGNIYGVDYTLGRIYQFNSKLELLDIQGALGKDGTASSMQLNYPRDLFCYSDDAFYVVEKYTDGSGAQRFVSYPEIRNLYLSVDRFTTDPTVENCFVDIKFISTYEIGTNSYVKITASELDGSNTYTILDNGPLVGTMTEVQRDNIALGNVDAGQVSYRWNGKDISQNDLPNGTYNILVTLTTIHNTSNPSATTISRSASARVEIADLSFLAISTQNDIVINNSTPVATLNYITTESCELKTSIIYAPDGHVENGYQIIEINSLQNIPVGSYSINWDGMVGGVYVNDGAYYFKIEAENEEGVKQVLYKMVLVSIQTVSAAIIGIEHAISLNTYDFISCRSAADYQNLKFHISEDAKAKVSIYNAQNQLMNETPLYSCDIGFNQIALRFNSDNGDYYSDGQYKVVLYVEENYNATANRSYEKPNIIIDNTPPGINYTTASQYFSPNGDGENDQVTITGLCTENSIIEAKIYFSEYWDNRSEIKRLQIQNGLSFSYSWDGTNNLNELMDDGVYYLGIKASDVVKNTQTSYYRIVLDNNSSIGTTERRFIQENSQRTHIYKKVDSHFNNGPLYTPFVPGAFPCYNNSGTKIAYCVSIEENMNGTAKLNLYVCNSDGTGSQFLKQFNRSSKDDLSSTCWSQRVSNISPIKWHPNNNDLYVVEDQTNDFHSKGRIVRINTNTRVETVVTDYSDIYDGSSPYVLSDFQISPDGQKVVFGFAGIDYPFPPLDGSGVPIKQGKIVLMKFDGTNKTILTPSYFVSFDWGKQNDQILVTEFLENGTGDGEYYYYPLVDRIFKITNMSTSPLIATSAFDLPSDHFAFRNAKWSYSNTDIVFHGVYQPGSFPYIGIWTSNANLFSSTKILSNPFVIYNPTSLTYPYDKSPGWLPDDSKNYWFSTLYNIAPVEKSYSDVDVRPSYVDLTGYNNENLKTVYVERVGQSIDIISADVKKQPSYYSPSVYIGEPIWDDPAYLPYVQINGTAQDWNFNGFTLEFGNGLDPSRYYIINQSNTEVAYGQIGLFDPRVAADGPVTIRLVVNDKAGNRAIQTFQWKVRNATLFNSDDPVNLGDRAGWKPDDINIAAAPYFNGTISSQECFNGEKSLKIEIPVGVGNYCASAIWSSVAWENVLFPPYRTFPSSIGYSYFVFAYKKTNTSSRIVLRFQVNGQWHEVAENDNEYQGWSIKTAGQGAWNMVGLTFAQEKTGTRSDPDVSPIGTWDKVLIGIIGQPGDAVYFNDLKYCNGFVVNQGEIASYEGSANLYFPEGEEYVINGQLRLICQPEEGISFRGVNDSKWKGLRFNPESRLFINGIRASAGRKVLEANILIRGVSSTENIASTYKITKYGFVE